MAANLSQDSAAAVCSQIATELAKYTLEAAPCKRQFVHTARFFKEWMNERKTEELAAKLWPNDPQPWVSGEAICRDSPKVFLILACIGRPGLITLFTRMSINDAKLPFRQAELLSHLGDSTEIGDREEFTSAFCDSQWKFCVRPFELQYNKEYPADEILPIVKKVPINDEQKGGTAKLWDIEVPEDFVGPILRDKVPHLAYEVEDKDKISRKHYHFALKEFHDGHDEVFENETRAFIALRGQPGMVMYLGHYRQIFRSSASGALERGTTMPGEERWSGTRNILLEYGDMDLEEYFATIRQPFLPQEISRFWEKVAAVASALESLHKLRVNNRVFKGWHADIKPSNLLLIKKTFKICDPGFAKFKLDDGENPEVHIHGGTRSFAAPEHYHATKPVSQKIDVWSLGCVFSVAATWVVDGHGALRDFRCIREDAVDRARNRPDNKLRARGDTFHDGETVLEEIAQWHNILRRSVRRTDTITPKILDLVDNQMLVSDPGARCDSSQLREQLDAIIKETAGGIEHGLVPEQIKMSLHVADKDASQPSSQMSQKSIDSLRYRSTESLNRREKKTVRMALPLKQTDSRDQYLTESIGKTSPPSITPMQDQGSVSPPPLNSIPLNLMARVSLPPGTAVENSATSDTPLSPTRTKEPHKPIDTAGLRELAKKYYVRRKGNFLKYKAKAIPKLEGYFDNRDIVFLLDNAYSMRGQWPRVVDVADDLFTACAGLDDDGIDIQFTMSHRVEKLRRDSTNLRNILKARAPSGPGMNTDMDAALGEVFERHLNHLHRFRANPILQKRLLILVFTDGRWEGNQNLDAVKDGIAKFYQKATRLRLVSGFGKRPIGIQFVRFDDDNDAEEKLKILDDDLAREKGIDDIVDTTHESGDAWKMILGSFIPEFDNPIP